MVYYLLLGLGVFLPFQFALSPAPGYDLAIIRILIPILFLYWLFKSVKNKKFLVFKNKQTYLLLIFLLLAFFSLFFSQNLNWSLRKLLFLLTIFPLYFVAAVEIDNKLKKRKLMIFLVIGATLVATVGIIQFLAQFIFGIDPVYNFIAKNIAPFFLGKTFSQSVLAYPSWLVSSNNSNYMRAISVFPDPHMLAYYLNLLLPFSVALWDTAKKYKNYFLLSSCILLFASIATFTRGGYIALIAGAVSVLPLVGRQTARKIFVSVAAIVIFFLMAPHNNAVSGRFASSFDTSEGSNQGRIYNWQQAIPVILNHPLGVGIGMYPLAVNPAADYREPIYAHDLYLDIAAELGIVAALVFVGYLLSALFSFWKQSKKDPLAIAGVASIVIFTVHSLVETPLYSVHVFTLILLISAISTKNFRNEEV